MFKTLINTNYIIISSFFAVSLLIFSTSCTKENDDAAAATNQQVVTEDTIAPLISLKEPGNNTTVFGTEYTDPGVNVTDNVDKNVEVTASGQVDEFSAGEHTITYTATDDAGNTAKTSRIITVDAAEFLQGTYHVDDSDPQVSLYTSEITNSYTQYNKIYIDFFAWFDGAEVTATLEGTSVTIEQQDIPSVGIDNKDRTFKGSGSFTDDKTLSIVYEFWLTGDPSETYMGSATYTYM